MLRLILTLCCICLYLPLQVQAGSLFFSEAKFKKGMVEQCHHPELDDSDWPVATLLELPQQSAMCLRFKLNIDTSELPDNTAIASQMLAARTIYMDGIEIGSSGIASSMASNEIPGDLSSVHLLPSNLLTDGPHLLSLQLSNFHIGGEITTWFYAVGLVNMEKALTEPLLNVTPALLFIGALLLISLFFQLLFWQYQARASYQVFSLQCFLSAMLLVAEHYRVLVGYSYDLHLTRMNIIMALTFLAMALLPTFYLLFYRMKRMIWWLSATLAGLVFALVIDPRYDAKSIIMFSVAIILCLLINAVALKHRQKGAKAGTALFSLLFLAFAFLPLPIIFSFIEQWFAFIYCIIILTIMTTLIAEMKHNRSKALSSARLETELLRRNLQPHFLMNSLMLVIEWIEHQPKAAVTFIQSLSEELRMLVQFSRQTHIPLTQEITLCRRHLEIMSHRYGSNYQLILEGDISDIDIPPAIIHTQIENAFTHNKIPDDAVFQLNLWQTQSSIVIELHSPFEPRRNKTANQGTGTGEDYIKARLNEQFENRYQYHSHAQDNHWINRITIEVSS